MRRQNRYLNYVVLEFLVVCQVVLPCSRSTTSNSVIYSSWRGGTSSTINKKKHRRSLIILHIGYISQEIYFKIYQDTCFNGESMLRLTSSQVVMYTYGEVPVQSQAWKIQKWYSFLGVQVWFRFHRPACLQLARSHWYYKLRETNPWATKSTYEKVLWSRPI